MMFNFNKEVWYVILVLKTIVGSGSGLLYLSSAFSNGYEIALILVTSVLVLISVFLIVKIAFTNPGYLAKITALPEEPIRIVEVFGNTILLKACSTCNIIKPPRAHHCKRCNLCVDRRDHHCPWVANCIGRNNHRLFIALLILLVTDSIFVVANCAYIVINVEDPPGLYIVESILIIVGVVCFWLVGGLLAYHLFLIFTNQTTYEHKKRVFPSGNPFQKGILENCKLFLSMIPEENIVAPKPVESTQNTN